MRRIIGPRHSMKISQQRHLAGNFNIHLRNLLLLVIEELGWAGNQEMEDVVKDLVTAGEVTFEAKGGSVESQKNFTRAIVCTNRPWAFPVSADERRVLAVDVKDQFAHLKTRKERQDASKVYFDALYAEIENGGDRAFLGKLERWPIGQVDLRRPPMTSGLSRQAMHSMAPSGRWLVEAVERGSFTDADGVTVGGYVLTAGKWEYQARGGWPLDAQFAVPESALKPGFSAAVKHHGPLTTPVMLGLLEEYVAVADKRIVAGASKDRERVLVFPPRLDVADQLSERAAVVVSLDPQDVSAARAAREAAAQGNVVPLRTARKGRSGRF